jgi:hypothetical protein
MTLVPGCMNWSGFALNGLESILWNSYRQSVRIKSNLVQFKYVCINIWSNFHDLNYFLMFQHD